MLNGWASCDGVCVLFILACVKNERAEIFGGVHDAYGLVLV